MSERSKKRYKDYKRIITMKTFDMMVYREGLPYLVKFNGDPIGKGIDSGDGRPGICIEASGANLTFVFVSSTFVHEEYNTKVVSISCEYLDNSKIEIIPYWSDTDVLKLIDAVKHNPDKFYGYNYWNEEVEIYDQDNVEKKMLNEYFGNHKIDGERYPFDVDEIQIETSTLVKEESVTENEEVDVSLRDCNDIMLGLDSASKEITKDVETKPDMGNFYIDDCDEIIDPDPFTKKYPLFVRNKHSSDRWIINYDVLRKALVRNDVIFDISFKMKNPLKAQGYCSCNSKDVRVHIGGSVLTGKRPGKKDSCSYDAVIEFRASDWKEMDFAHVHLRKKLE